MRQNWLEIILSAFENLKWEADYFDIYKEIKKMNCVKFTNSWEATVRQKIESHSSDSKNFKGVEGDQNDIFYRISRGRWGVRKQHRHRKHIKNTKGGSRTTHTFV